MRRRFLLALAAFSVAAPLSVASAEPPPLVPREVLFGNPTRAAPRLSPDGRRLAYLRADDKGVLQVWVKTIGTDDDAAVTQEKTRGIRRYHWSWDGKRILYSQDSGGNERFHLYAVDLARKETRDLTPIAGVTAFVAAHEPETPGTVLVSMNRRRPDLFDVWSVDLATGALVLVEENPGGVADWVVDTALRVRGAVRATDEGGGILQVRDDPESPWREILRWELGDDVNVSHFSRDGRRIFATSNVGRDTLALVEVDVATGEAKVLAEDEGSDVSDVEYDLVTKEPRAVAFRRDRVRWRVLDPGVEKDFRALDALDEGDLQFSSRDLSDRTWIVAYSSDARSTRFHVWHRSKDGQGKGEFLFSAKPEIDAYALAPMQFVEIPSRDGLSLPSYLTLPPGVEPKNLPLVLDVHGGPWARDSWGFHPEVQLLANRGYAVLQVNYRGSGGFGKKFKNAARREFAGKMHDDLIDGVEWAVKRGIADPKKVAIMGGSYGGYATLVGLAFTPDVFCCGVDVVGPSNLVSLVESFPPYWKTGLASSWYPFVGNPADPKERADMEARSPLFKVDRIKSPLLIAQGANDPRVTKKESDQMVEALKKAGREVEYHVYEDEGHGFARPENRMHHYATVEAFLAKHLGGRAEPPAAPKEPAAASAPKRVPAGAGAGVR